MARKRNQLLERRSLRLNQNQTNPLYLFSLTGKELLRIADISRISRDDGGRLIGYQRPEVKRHVQDIVTYLDSDNVIFPNSIILALSSDVRFRSSRGPKVNDGVSAAGTLEIPLPHANQRKPAWIVDGQQRAIAISKSKRQDLAVPISAFIADNVDLQRDQFLRINNTRPLPRGLLTELLPEVAAPLPTKLAARKIPAAICELLAREKRSPFYGLIRRSSMNASQRRKAVIADSSIVKMVQESLSTPSGCLFPYRNIATGETDFDGIWAVLISYWTAVERTFPDAWGKAPSKSRLMHGAGLRAMGRLMDKVMTTVVNPRSRNAVKSICSELDLIAPVTRWTRGTWEDLGLRWNEIQNVPTHVRMLTNVLIRSYVEQQARAA